jgi:hypothetical protein
MSSTPGQAISQAIYDALSADATIDGLVAGIYEDRPPAIVSMPYILVRVLPSTPRQTLALNTAFEEFLVEVRAIDETGAGSPTIYGERRAVVETLAGRIRALLIDAALTVTGYTLMRCRLVQGINYPESGPYAQVGGRFAVTVCAAP